ncbi:hypothetical protein [Streptomyces smyrnaeus]|uniref:hypothetical protein n=1 Tax=Streptomyces smyrnaeus TaxID=1387713 RepID=UPI0033E4AD11
MPPGTAWFVRSGGQDSYPGGELTGTAAAGRALGSGLLQEDAPGVAVVADGLRGGVVGLGQGGEGFVVGMIVLSFVGAL